MKESKCPLLCRNKDLLSEEADTDREQECGYAKWVGSMAAKFHLCSKYKWT